MILYLVKTYLIVNIIYCKLELRDIWGGDELYMYITDPQICYAIEHSYNE